MGASSFRFRPEVSGEPTPFGLSHFVETRDSRFSVHCESATRPAGAFACALQALIENPWSFPRDAGSGPIALRFEVARAVTP
jgi:hypothetical protein